MKKFFSSIIATVMAFVVSGFTTMAAEVASKADEIPAATIEETTKIMGQGMLGIFIVMVLIFIVIVLLNKTTNK